jgi:tRNA (mo5U34)-methyltransferase
MTQQVMTEQMTKEMNNIKWWHRIKLPNGEYTPGEVVHGPDGGDWPTTRFGIPDNLANKKVIDVGAWDGFFSFEAENRGAALVLATDAKQEDGGNWGHLSGFSFAKKALNSKVEYKEFNIESREDMNEILKINDNWDLVMCYGVFYHLKSPLIAAENLSKLTKNGIILVETAISSNNDCPMLEYRPRFANDPTNYFYPNSKWIEVAFKEYGAKNFEMIFLDRTGTRATYRIEK